MTTDQQLNDLINELRDLTRTLGSQRTTGPAPGTINAQDNELKQTRQGFEQGTRQIVFAIGKLVSKLDGVTKTKVEEYRELRQFASNVQESVDKQEKAEQRLERMRERQERALAEQAEALRRSSLTAEELAKEDRQRAADEWNRERDEGIRRRKESARNATEWWNQMRRGPAAHERIMDDFVGRFGDSSGKLNETQKIVTMGLEGFKAALTGAVAGVTQFASALNQGQRGLQVSARAITAISEPLLEFGKVLGAAMVLLSFTPLGRVAKGAATAMRGLPVAGRLLGKALDVTKNKFFDITGKMGPFGKAIEGIVGFISKSLPTLLRYGGLLLGLGSSFGKIALKINELAAEQVDKLFGGFIDLAKVGVAGQGGISDVFELLQTLGMTVSEMEAFRNIIGKNSKELAMMGGTAMEGARAYAKVAGTLVKDYGEEFLKMGVPLEELRESSMAYMQIQARTGRLQLSNTQQLVKSSADFVRQLDLAAQLTGESVEEQRKKVLEAQLDERYRYLQMQAEATGDPELLRIIDITERLAKFLPAESQKGLRQFAAGGPVTTEARGAASQYGLYELYNRPGKVSDDEIVNLLEQNLKRSEEIVTVPGRYIGKIEDLVSSVGPAADLRLNLTRAREEAAKTGESTMQVLERLQRDRAQTTDEFTKAAVAAKLNQQSAAMYQDSALKITAAAEVNAYWTSVYKDAVGKFTEAVKEFTGAKSPAGGVFRTSGDTVSAGPGAVAPGVPTTVAGAALGERLAKLGKTSREAEELKNKELDKNKQAIKVEEQTLQEMYRRGETTQKINEQTAKIQKLKDEQVKLETEQKDIAKKHTAEVAKAYEDFSKDQKQLQGEKNKLINLQLQEGALNKYIEERTQKRVALEKELETSDLSPSARSRREGQLAVLNKEITSAVSSRQGVQQKIGQQRQAIQDVEREQAKKYGITTDLSQLFEFGGDSGSMANFNQLDADFKQRVITAAQEYNQLTGKKITVNSAYRSYDDQKRLYEQSKAAGTPGILNGRPVADPDSTSGSMHTQGKAIDINNYTDVAAIEAFRKQGLFQRIDDDKPHFTMAQGGVIPATPGGVNVIAAEAGRDEAFVPLDKARRIPVSLNIDALAKRLEVKQMELAEKADEKAEANIKTATKQAIESAPGTSLLEQAVRTFNKMNQQLESITDILASTQDIQGKLLSYNRG